jgi:hypothetical protein
MNFNPSPYANGSAEDLLRHIVSLFPNYSFDDEEIRKGSQIWRERTIAFLAALTPPLVFIRDKYGLPLDADLYLSFIELPKAEELAWKGEQKYPGLDCMLDPLKTYLIYLPGYDRDNFEHPGQDRCVRDQFRYITMEVKLAFTRSGAQSPTDTTNAPVH